MKKLLALQEERNKVWKVQTDLKDLADKEDRSLTAEETNTWDKADEDFTRLTGEIDVEKRRIEDEGKRLENFNSRQALMDDPGERQSQMGTGNPGDGGRGEQREMTELDKENRHFDALSEYREDTNGETGTQEYRKAYAKYVIGGLAGAFAILSDDEKRTLTQYRATLQADNDAGGGFLVVPEQFIARLIQAKDNALFVRQHGTVIPVPNAASLGAPSLDNDPDDPTWTAEILTGGEDTVMRFGKRELHPHPLARRIKISKKLIRVSRMNVVNIVRNRLAHKFTVVEESNFLTGNGANQPLGVFTASNDGISTNRDISEGNTATAITADNLINVKYNQKAQYRKTSRWLFHRDAIKMIRKLKDGEGNYLWRPGLATDRPDTILDIGFDESEYAPNTFTTGLYVGLLADWSYYWIADALNMQIQVLTELYAETNQNGYIGRAETDGMPVLEEAFARVKLG